MAARKKTTGKGGAKYERLTPAEVHERYKDRLDEEGKFVPEFAKDLQQPQSGYTVGGYAIDAYCANHGTNQGTSESPRFCEQGQGVGQTEAQALRDLRQGGWIIRRKKDSDGNMTEVVICPRCVRNGVKPS